MIVVPPRIVRSVGGGFADYTITCRFPEIMRRAIAGLQSRSVAAILMDRLLQEVTSGAKIERDVFAMPTPKWREFVEGLDQADWASLPFFEVELLFYHAINSLAGYFSDGTDVFLHTRQQSLRLARLDSLEPVVDGPCPRATMAALVRSALFGNEADESMALADRRRMDGSPQVLVDHGSALVDRLLRCTGRDATVHMLVDNTGPELIRDLALVDAILAIGDARVVVHCKPWPMFVSDALISDVDATILRMTKEGPAAVRARGIRLATAAAAGRLDLRAETDWGEPRCFGALDHALSDQLRAATVVISKGDLSYRRFVEDRAWAADVPVTQAVAGVSFGAFALRVLKSEAVVGIPPRIVSAVSRASPDWRTNGRHAVVQWLGS